MVLENADMKTSVSATDTSAVLQLEKNNIYQGNSLALIVQVKSENGSSNPQRHTIWYWIR